MFAPKLKPAVTTKILHVLSFPLQILKIDVRKNTMPISTSKFTQKHNYSVFTVRFKLSPFTNSRERGNGLGVAEIPGKLSHTRKAQNRRSVFLSFASRRIGSGRRRQQHLNFIS